MHLVLAHIKQGLEAVGKETSSETYDTRATDSSSCHTAPSSASSQVLNVYCCFFWLVVKLLKHVAVSGQ